MARAGRKRKQGVEREPNGQRRRVHAHDVARLQVAAQRARHGLSAADLLDARAGTEIGRALLRGQITPDQYEAGEEFLRRWVRWAAMSGIPMPTVRALDYTQEVRGGWGGAHPSNDEVLAIRRRYAEMYGGASPGLAAFNAVKTFVVEDSPAPVMTEAGLDVVRAALQGYAVLFGIVRPTVPAGCLP